MDGIEYIGKCVLIESNGKRILVIGDLHLGYEEAMNRTGVLVARQMYEDTIADLREVFASIGKVDEVVLLGDVKHVFGTVLKQERKDLVGVMTLLDEWSKQIIIVKGNHDPMIEVLVHDMKVKVKEVHLSDGFAFVHGDKDFKEIHGKEVKCWIIGHGHPAIRLSDSVKTEKYKCFLEGTYKGKNVVIVPSFIAHSEGSDPREYDLGLAWDFNLRDFEVIAVGENLQTLRFGKLKNLREEKGRYFF